MLIGACNPVLCPVRLFFRLRLKSGIKDRAGQLSTLEADMDREEKLLRKGKNVRRASGGQSAGPTGQSRSAHPSAGDPERPSPTREARSPRLGSRLGLALDGDRARAESRSPIMGASPGISPKLPRWLSSGGSAASASGSPTPQSRPLPAPPDERASKGLYDSPADALVDPRAAAAAAAKRGYEPLYAQVAEVLGLPAGTSRTPEPMPRRFSAGSPSMRRRSSLGSANSSVSAEIKGLAELMAPSVELMAPSVELVEPSADTHAAASPASTRDGTTGSPPSVLGEEKPKPSRKAPPPPMPPTVAGTGLSRRSTWSASGAPSPRGSIDKGEPPFPRPLLIAAPVPAPPRPFLSGSAPFTRWGGEDKESQHPGNAILDVG